MKQIGTSRDSRWLEAFHYRGRGRRTHEFNDSDSETKDSRLRTAIGSSAALGRTLAPALLASAAFCLPTAWTGSFVNSAFCKRCITKLETETVAITIAHGMTGEIQRSGVAKLISAIQARLAKAPNKNATRREPDLNGKGYRHNPCTITAKGKATTKSTK